MADINCDRYIAWPMDIGYEGVDCILPMSQKCEPPYQTPSGPIWPSENFYQIRFKDNFQAWQVLQLLTEPDRVLTRLTAADRVLMEFASADIYLWIVSGIEQVCRENEWKSSTYHLILLITYLSYILFCWYASCHYIYS